MVTDEQMYNNLIACHFNEELDHFNESLNEYALRLTLRLCSRPNFPRSAAFDVILEIKSFMKEITCGTNKKIFILPIFLFIIKIVIMGLETVVMPKIEDPALLQSFISSVDTSFVRVRTEASLNVLLTEMNLTKPLIKIDVALNKRIDDDSDSDENADESDNDRAAEAVELIERPKWTLTIMPLEYQIKQFFELPNVFAKIQSNYADIFKSFH